MSGAPSIEQLCRMTRNEDIHAEHVTAMALQLFDALASVLGLRAADRRLLEAAGRLHDAGYASSPSDHVRVGANLVLKHGVDGFSEAQVRETAAIMLLHSGPVPKRRQHPVFATLRDPARIERMGALLRVADGLDHGHAQNARIEALHRHAAACELRVSSPGYAGNIPWAEKKADLWHEVLPLDLRIVPQDGPARQPFAGIVGDGVSRPVAIKRILHSQFRLLADERDGVLEGSDPEHLHRLRIALRRFRVACRFFAKPLRGTSADALQQELAELTRRLGPARDGDVWLEMLARCRPLTGPSHPERWEKCLAAARKERARHYEAAARVLSGGDWVSLQHQLKYFLRAELSDWLRRARPVPFASAMEKALEDRLRRCARRKRLRKSADLETLHDVRRDLRRERCIAEMAEPVLDVAPVLARRYKAVVQTLGMIHDHELHLERLRARRSPPPPGLIELLEAECAEAWARYRTAWSKLKELAKE